MVAPGFNPDWGAHSNQVRPPLGEFRAMLNMQVDRHLGLGGATELSTIARTASLPGPSSVKGKKEVKAGKLFTFQHWTGTAYSAQAGFFQSMNDVRREAALILSRATYSPSHLHILDDHDCLVATVSPELKMGTLESDPAGEDCRFPG